MRNLERVDPSAADLAVLLTVVALRLAVPLFIPRFPLPAIVLALIIDAADQTIFQTYLTHGFWLRIEDAYQGYDKSLDVFYLSMAYVATMRNWSNRTALVTAQFLWLYRLAGVTLFEVVHDAADPSSWRWLLLVFPNTFEYFFIAYEAIRLRWNPLRMRPRLVVGIAAFIWIFIKLPQEWWIHVAQLDLSDEMDAHGWIAWLIVAVVILAVAVIWWAVTHRLPPEDWTLQVAAPPFPEELDTSAERSAWRAEMWKLFDWNLVEKVVLVALVCVDFAQIMPHVTATNRQILLSVTVLVVVNSAMGMAFVRRGHSIQSFGLQFVVQLALNLGIVWLGRLFSGRFNPNDAMFFVLLITLITTLYDRYRPIRELRRGLIEPPPAPVAVG
jgi:hypothetical protein